jgi:multiple sugar transport system permease protein
MSTHSFSVRMGNRRVALLYVPMVLLALCFALPIEFVVISSFKSDEQIFRDLSSSFAAFLPTANLSFDNYYGVFDRVPVGRFFLNTFFIALCTVVLGLVVNSMCGYALARLKWRGQNLVMAVIVATLIVPFDTIAVPLLFEVTLLPAVQFNGLLSLPSVTTGWLDNYYVQILPFVANSFSIFLFRQYFSSIPFELDEAARVDGAGVFTIYRRVIVPLAGPAFATAAILTFLPAWNQYLWPLIVTQSETVRPINVGMDYFFQLKVAWGQVMAYASMIIMPVVVVFIGFQRAFVSSIAATGLKG